MKYQLLLKIVVCPICYARLFLNIEHNKLVCRYDNLYFPINQGIPVLLKKEDYRLVSQENNL